MATKSKRINSLAVQVTPSCVYLDYYASDAPRSKVGVPIRRVWELIDGTWVLTNTCMRTPPTWLEQLSDAYDDVLTPGKRSAALADLARHFTEVERLLKAAASHFPRAKKKGARS